MDAVIGPGPRAGTFVVRLPEEVDLYCTMDLWYLLDPLLAKGNSQVLVDCSGLKYLDSSGLGVFIRALQKARANGVGFGLAGLGGAPRRVLQMSSLAPLFRQVADAGPASPFWQAEVARC